MNTVQKPDLSFTENPEWQEQRLLLWSQIEKDLNSDYRKKQIEDFKQYFLFGNVQGRMEESGKNHGSTALLYWYPLQSTEGWDYVLQCLCPKSHVYEYEFYGCINGHQNAMPDMDTQLSFFDYFHPAKYTPIIRSRVPIGKQGEIVEIVVDKTKILKRFLSTYTLFFEEGEESLTLYRVECFISLLDVFELPEDEKSRGTVQRLSKRLLRQVCNFQPKVEILDTSRQLALIEKLKEYFERESLNPALVDLKEQVEKEYVR